MIIIDDILSGLLKNCSVKRVIPSRAVCFDFYGKAQLLT